MSQTGYTVRSLRAEAKAAYAGGKGNKALKGYSKMRKAQLMQLLGKKGADKTRTRFQHKKTAERISKLASDVETKLGGREAVLKAVKKAVNKTRATARKEGREPEQQELRKAAIAAIRKEAELIKGRNKAIVYLQQKAKKTKKSKGKTKRQKSQSKLGALLTNSVYERGVDDNDIFGSEEAISGEPEGAKKEDWNTSTTVLKRRFRRLSRIFHPDLGGTEEQMINLNHAYNNARVWPELHEKYEREKIEKAAKKAASAARKAAKKTKVS